MRARVPAAVVTAAALIGLTACSGGGDPAPRDRQGGSAAPAGQLKGSLPDLGGLDLATASKRVTDAGFDDPRAVDASGQDRAPSPPADWKVCSQSLPPGEYPTGVALDLSVLKTSEDCAKPPEPTRDPTTSPSPSPSASQRSASPSRTPSPTRPGRPGNGNGGGNGGKGGWPTIQWPVFYMTCADAKAAGVTPLHRGDPGYGPHLDRDGDGTACE